MINLVKCQHCSKEFFESEHLPDHKLLGSNEYCIGNTMQAIKVCGICGEEDCGHFELPKIKQEQLFWEKHLGGSLFNIDKWEYIFSYG